MRYFIAAFLLGAVSALILHDDVGRLPALGWNSWNAYGCNINATTILDAAAQMVSLGLKVVRDPSVVYQGER